jgi:hypothetical protein
VPPLAASLPIVGGLFGGVGGLVKGVLTAIFKLLFGLPAKATVGVVVALVAHPVYTDQAAYGPLNAYRAYVTAGAWGLFALVLAMSGLRYWACGFSSSGSYEALSAFARSVAAAASLVAFPEAFGYASMLTNQLTHALLAFPGVHDGIAKLLAAVTIGSSLGLGMIAGVVAVLLLVLLIVTKVVISAMLAVLFAATPLAIALSPLPEAAFLLRTCLSGIAALFLWPVVWAIAFAVFAVLGDGAFSASGGLGPVLLRPFVTVAALYVAWKAPLLIARHAMLAGLTPSASRGMSGVSAVARHAGARQAAGRVAQAGGEGTAASAASRAGAAAGGA